MAELKDIQLEIIFQTVEYLGPLSVCHVNSAETHIFHGGLEKQKKPKESKTSSVQVEEM